MPGKVFAGGAALYFMRPQAAPVEVLNDINGDLVTLYRVAQNHLEEFVCQFKWALSSRQVYEWQKMARPETLTDIQRAARFFYLQHHAFASKVAGQTFGTATTGLRSACCGSVKPGNGCPFPTSKTFLGLTARNATTGLIPFLTWTRCIGKPPAMREIPFENYKRITGFMRSSKGKWWSVLTITRKSDECSMDFTLRRLTSCTATSIGEKKRLRSVEGL